ncbi:MAG: glycosyltransferase [Clostridiales bacterium]|nr:glycosyltransferase [Clostridiales bacterium]
MIDNSETPNRGRKEAVHTVPNSVYIELGDNYGIGKALNCALRWAKREGFEWLLTMDQDTIVKADAIEYARSYLSCTEIGNIGIACLRWTEDVGKGKYDFLKFALTSGSIVNIEIAEKIGKFNEAFFIDGVDMEFCYRLYLHGYRMIRLNEAVMVHFIGNKKKIMLGSGEAAITHNYPPVRYYYIFRNYFYLIKQYGKYSSLEDEIQRAKIRLWEYFVSIPYEKQPLKKYACILKGFCHFVLKKQGRYY